MFSYKEADQNLDKIRGKGGLLGDGVGEGVEGPAQAVREGVQQDPAKVDSRFLCWADDHRHKLRTSSTIQHGCEIQILSRRELENEARTHAHLVWLMLT